MQIQQGRRPSPIDTTRYTAGAAGCLLASSLAKSLPHHSILLLDAGGPNTDPSHQTFGERHWTLKNATDYNWGYKTVPQENLAGREIDCSRGKGLGGSTAINFCIWTRGSKNDYEKWAEIVGCDDWRWNNVLERFKTVPVLCFLKTPNRS